MITVADRLSAEAVLPDVYASVEPAWPQEGCGFVFLDPEQDRLVVLPTANRAEELHARFPDRYPRGGADWFEPDMKPWLRALRAGWTPLVIYHSHPEVGAYFSSSDQEMAVMRDDEGHLQPRHAGVFHLVVSVRQGKADGAKLFTFEHQRSCFVPCAAYDSEGRVLPFHEEPSSPGRELEGTPGPRHA